MLIGEGEYNLNDLKEIKVTDSYVGLGQDVTKCQNEEPFFNCTTKQHINTFLRKCGCLPFAMQLSFGVCSSPKELECANKVDTETAYCLKPCSGLYVTSFSRSDVTDGMENLMPILENYNNYKRISEYPSGESGKYIIFNFIITCVKNY